VFIKQDCTRQCLWKKTTDKHRWFICVHLCSLRHGLRLHLWFQISFNRTFARVLLNCSYIVHL